MRKIFVCKAEEQSTYCVCYLHDARLLHSATYRWIPESVETNCTVVFLHEVKGEVQKALKLLMIGFLL